MTIRTWTLLRTVSDTAGKCAAGWNVKRPNLTGLDAIEAYYYQFKKDIHINAYCAVEWALFGHDLQDFGEV